MKHSIHFEEGTISNHEFLPHLTRNIIIIEKPLLGSNKVRHFDQFAKEHTTVPLLQWFSLIYLNLIQRFEETSLTTNRSIPFPTHTPTFVPRVKEHEFLVLVVSNIVFQVIAITAWDKSVIGKRNIMGIRWRRGKRWHFLETEWLDIGED